MTVQELLDNVNKWTKRAYARTRAGLKCSSSDPLAVCWCLQGAINRCYPYDRRPAIEAKVIAIINRLSRKPLRAEVYDIGLFNDRSRSFKSIQQVVEEANI